MSLLISIDLPVCSHFNSWKTFLAVNWWVWGFWWQIITPTCREIYGKNKRWMIWLVFYLQPLPLVVTIPCVISWPLPSSLSKTRLTLVTSTHLVTIALMISWTEDSDSLFNIPLPILGHPSLSTSPLSLWKFLKLQK